MRAWTTANTALVKQNKKAQQASSLKNLQKNLIKGSSATRSSVK
jgi:hypothetical protein